MTDPQEAVLAGQVALVTGASAGIGRRFALALAGAGATVVATARRADRLSALAEEISAAGGLCVPFAVDLADAQVLTDLVDRVSTEIGLITILVNNAGIVDAKRAHRMPLELVDAVLDTNLRAPWLLATQVAARLIAQSRPGRIVNVSSVGARHYAHGSAAALYSTTKAALNRMTEVLAVEWAGNGINVNAISPGAVQTEMLDGMFARLGASADEAAARQPRGRLLQPAQLEGTLLFLVGQAAEAVTGTVITVDDGQTPR